MKTKIGQQGEIAIIKLDSAPSVDTKPVAARPDGKTVISHSESGNHHVLSCDNVVEAVEVPDGLQIFYAAVENAERLEQESAGNPHEPFDLGPGWYQFTISREYDPFMEQARRVAD